MRLLQLMMLSKGISIKSKNNTDFLYDLIVKNKEIYIPDIIRDIYHQDTYQDAYKKLTCSMWKVRTDAS